MAMRIWLLLLGIGWAAALLPADGAAAPADDAPATGPAAFGWFDVRDFGARGDGAADDTAAFQRAADAAGRQGGTVVLPPTPPGSGYVLTRTVALPEGVTLMGSPAGSGSSVRAVFRIDDQQVRGVKILARPAREEYEGARKKPLFQLGPGCAVRGLWILYDQQPMPADEDFQDPASPFHYPSFEAARAGFVRDHVKPYGPTFYAPFSPNLVIEDVICDRYYDFIFLVRGGKTHLNRLTMHGYRRAIVIARAHDVAHVSNIAVVPNVGPQGPGAHHGRHYTWAYAAIAADPGNVGLWLGRADGYHGSDVFFFAIHTALRLGHSAAWPLVDPVAGAPVEPEAPGHGPWGAIEGLMADQCAVGVHLVWPSGLTNRVANLALFPSFRDGRMFDAVADDGTTRGLGRQAAFLVEPTHTRANCNGRLPVFMAANTVIASFNDTERFGPLAAPAHQADGRVFLVDGDAAFEMSGIVINPPYGEERLWARGPAAREVSLRLRGLILRDAAVDDRRIAFTAGAGAAP